MEQKYYSIPNQCRYAKTVAEARGYTFEIIDNEEGYLFQISDGKKSFLSGTGALSSYPLNNATSVSIARDKVYTNLVLSRAGIANLGGRCFFLSAAGRQLRKSGYELEDGREYAAEIGFPIFCKPVAGSRGDFAEVIDGIDRFDDYVERVAARHHAIVIQPLYLGTEYRVFVFDEAPLFCIKKSPIQIVGDGKRSIRELLSVLNISLKGSGISLYPIDTTAVWRLGELTTVTFVPEAGEVVEICGRKNLAAGGDVEQVSPMPDELSEIAVLAARALGLRIAAVDLLKCKVDNHVEQVKVIELNSNPDIVALERIGRWDVIERIWLTTIETMLK